MKIEQWKKYKCLIHIGAFEKDDIVTPIWIWKNCWIIAEDFEYVTLENENWDRRYVSLNVFQYCFNDII